MPPIFGGIEAGGTKFVCAVGSGPGQVLAQVQFPTTDPTETIGKAVDFLRSQHERTPLSAIGIGSFGPVDLNPASPTFGTITTTPKPGWANTPMAEVFRQVFGLPVAFDTDVNGAALGEYRWGAAKGLENFIYLTIGTGIGGGIMTGGRLLHGLVHPEMGHILLPHDWQEDPFEGMCPYHGDCLEGLASGPAMLRRWGKPAQTLPADHPAWKLEAAYLARALSIFICTLSPQRVILGGGVMQQVHLLPLIRQQVQLLLNNYIAAPELRTGIDQYIVTPGLGAQAGVLGTLALAAAAFNQSAGTAPHS